MAKTMPPVRLVTMLLITQCFLHTMAVARQAPNSVLFIVDTASTGDLQSPYKNFYYHDISLQGHPLHFSDDSMYVTVDHPFFLLQANEAQNPFLIYPGETIHLQVLSGGEARLTIPGNQRRTHELNFYTELVRKTGNLSFAFKLPPFLKKVSTVEELQQYETMIGNVRQTRLRLLQEQASTYSFSKEFVQIAASSINSTALRDSVELYGFNKDFLQKQQLYQARIAACVRSAEKIPISTSRFDLQAIGDLANVAAAGKTRYNEYRLQEFEQQYKVINQLFTGCHREYLQFKALYDAASRHVDIPAKYLDSFKGTAQDAVYKAMLTDRLESTKGMATTEDDMLLDEAGQQLTLKQVLKKHAGSLVLLDFWASWCAPCRAEMKPGKALLARFTGKPITIVYLSTDENKKAWQNAVMQEKLSANSYLLISPYRAKIITEHKVLGIPRYMLIDKKGKFISVDAPRPSDPLLVTLIEKHLL